MNYFELHAADKIVKQFANLYENLLEYEAPIRREMAPELRPRETQLEVIKAATLAHGVAYFSVRTQITERINSLIEIANQIGVNVNRVSYPPPAFGGYPITLDIFTAIINNPGYIEIPYIDTVDCLNQIKGAIAVQKRKALFRLFNPLVWLQKVLRIPFLLIQATGFNIVKVEDHLLGKLFKLLELLLLIYLGTHILGLSKENLLAFLNVIPK